MTITSLIVNQLKEVRRQSLRIWKGLPPEFYLWRPDPEARHMLEVIRHVLKGDKWFQYIIEHRGDINNYDVFNDDRPYTDLQNELDFHCGIREEFLRYVSAFTDEEMQSVKIYRTDKGGAEWERPLADYLLRMIYHESVHAGQILANMRAMGVERPYVWDDVDG